MRSAKAPIKPPLIRYSDARRAIVEHLCDPTHSISSLVAAEHMFNQRAGDPAESALRQDDAVKSVEVLHSIQGMRNQLGHVAFAPAPRTQPKLIIAGVEVSVHADCLVEGSTGGVAEIGAAVLRMT